MAERIRYNTIVEQVMGKLKSLIASGEYQPGDKLPSENALAERFGIGRSSVREAIKVFQYIGVLASYTAKGTFVCERTNISTEALTWSIILGYNDLYELLELRELLERRGIASLVEKYRSHPREGAELLGRLEENVARMRSSADLEKIIEADYSFHNSVIEGCGNSVFLAIYQTLKSFMHDLIKEVHVEQGTAQEPAPREEPPGHPRGDQGRGPGPSPAGVRAAHRQHPGEAEPGDAEKKQGEAGTEDSREASQALKKFFWPFGMKL